MRNKLVKGAEIEIMTPDKDFLCNIDEMFDLEENEIESIHGGAGEKFVKINYNIPVGSILRVKS